MTTVNMHEAKTHLSQLVAKVEAGEEIIISRDGKPVAKLTQIDASPGAKFGSMKDQIWISPNFDDPDPDLERLFDDSPLVNGDLDDQKNK
jgi:prevent-host-death family protein